MVTWEDIVNTVQGFFEWLTGAGAGFTNTLGELGSWIFGGFQWLGDRFKEAWNYFSDRLKEGLQWIGDRLKDAYDTLSYYLSPAFQWIGSGLSWIGQNIYNFGSWIYNGLVWIANAAWNLIRDFINWLMRQLSDAWNNVVTFANNFINSINQHLNDWILGLRDKFKWMILVNLTVPTVMSSMEKYVESPSLAKVIGMLSAPFVGAVVTELVDVVVPKPTSTQVPFFPTFELPMWRYEEYTPVLPEYFTEPQQTGTIKPPAVGYISSVEMECRAYTSVQAGSYFGGVIRKEASLTSKSYSSYQVSVS